MGTRSAQSYSKHCALLVLKYFNSFIFSSCIIVCAQLLLVYPSNNCSQMDFSDLAVGLYNLGFYSLSVLYAIWALHQVALNIFTSQFHFLQCPKLLLYIFKNLTLYEHFSREHILKFFMQTSLVQYSECYDKFSSRKRKILDSLFWTFFLQNHEDQKNLFLELWFPECDISLQIPTWAHEEHILPRMNTVRNKM